jgi:hypothetical protein
MTKTRLLLLRQVLPLILMAFFCSDIHAQSGQHMIDRFPAMTASVSEENPSLFSVVVNSIPVYSREFERMEENRYKHREPDLRVLVADSAALVIKGKELS